MPTQNYATAIKQGNMEVSVTRPSFEFGMCKLLEAPAFLLIVMRVTAPLEYHMFQLATCCEARKLLSRMVLLYLIKYLVLSMCIAPTYIIINYGNHSF